jgi:2-haloacid dehalogenase
VITEPTNGRYAVVFDFGGVLVDWDPFYLYASYFDGNRAAMQQFLQEIGFAEWNRQQDGGRSFAQGVEELCAHFPQYCHLIRAYDLEWAESISGPIEPVVAILRELDRRGVDLYAISNWSAEKYELIRPRYDFFKLFREVVISGQVRMLKPDREIFEYLLAKIGRPAYECILIDDMAENIATARRLGFQTIHYQRPAQLQAELAAFDLLPKPDGAGSSTNRPGRQSAP